MRWAPMSCQVRLSSRGRPEDVSCRAFGPSMSPAPSMAEITVPKGKKGGQKMKITLPNGSEAEIQIPKGLKAGGKFQVNLG